MLLKPMLAHQAKDEQAILRDPDYTAEVKYDGHRAQLIVGFHGVQLLSRFGKDKMAATPFLRGLEKVAPSMVLDGELIVPGGTSSDVVDLSKQEHLVYVAFDLLSWGDHESGGRFYERPFEYRRACLEHLVRLIGWPRLELSEVSDDGVALFERVKSDGGEGVMMKQKDAPYVPGKRTWHWQKVKCWQTYDVVVTGCDAEPTLWTVRPGQYGTDGVLYPDGKPSSTKLAGYVGLTYGWYVDGQLRTVGKLGYTGPRDQLEPLVGRVAEVKGWGLYRSGAIRHPGVMRFRDDKLAMECVFSEELATLK